MLTTTELARNEARALVAAELYFGEPPPVPCGMRARIHLHSFTAQAAWVSRQTAPGYTRSDGTLAHPTHLHVVIPTDESAVQEQGAIFQLTLTKEIHGDDARRLVEAVRDYQPKR